PTQNQSTRSAGCQEMSPMMISSCPFGSSSGGRVRAWLATAVLVGIGVAGCAKDRSESMAWTPPPGGHNGAADGFGGMYVPPTDGLTPVQRHGQLAVVGNHLV